MFTTSVGVNLISAIIYDVLKTTYNRLNPEEGQIKKQIHKYVRDNISNEIKFQPVPDRFENFFKLPQVYDVIHAYIIYIISGTVSKELAKATTGTNKRYIEEINIIDYLVKCFRDYYNTTVNLDEGQLSFYFSNIFSLAKNFFISQLDVDTKFGIYSINYRLDDRLGLVLDKLDKYQQIIEDTIKIPLVIQNSEYDQIRDEYMAILKTKHNKAHIYLLDDFDLDKFYIPPKLSMNIHRNNVTRHMLFSYGNEWIRSDNYESWKNIFLQDNIVYVTGGAGYGKSLLMKNIIINLNALNIIDITDHIVIYGEIKWCINKDGSFKSMTEFLRLCISNATLKTVDESFIDYYLKMGRCILLLDALDEVPMEKRKDLHHTIIAHLRNLNPNNKACLTSRDRGFIPVQGEIEHFKIEPLDADQIEQYVDRIIKLKKFSQQDKEPFMQQAKVLVEKRFLNSFLILSLLINIYKGERELPETKLELYQKCLEYIANKRERPKTTDTFDWKLIAPLMKDNTFIELSLLCFPNNKEIKEREIISKLKNVYCDTFIDIATLENAICEFLKFCSERTELFVPANVENSFKFFHRSFFEYFYSKHIVLRCKNSDEIFEKLTAFDVDSEIFELTLARLKQETQDKYISTIKYGFKECELDFASETPSLKSLNILTLFFQVIDEETFRIKFVNLITAHSELIVKNIDKLSNEEIIYNVIIQSGVLERVIAEYKQPAYREISYLFKNLDISDLEHILEQERRSREQPHQNQDILVVTPFSYHYNYHFNRYHFYTAALMSQYSLFTLLEKITHEPVRINKKYKAKIRKLVEYYNSLDEKNKELLDHAFLPFSF